MYGMQGFNEIPPAGEKPFPAEKAKLRRTFSFEKK
jgi:hypothetical protein